MLLRIIIISFILFYHYYNAFGSENLFQAKQNIYNAISEGNYNEAINILNDNFLGLQSERKLINIAKKIADSCFKNEKYALATEMYYYCLKNERKDKKGQLKKEIKENYLKACLLQRDKNSDFQRDALKKWYHNYESEIDNYDKSIIKNHINQIYNTYLNNVFNNKKKIKLSYYKEGLRKLNIEEINKKFTKIEEIKKLVEQIKTQLSKNQNQNQVYIICNTIKKLEEYNCQFSSEINNIKVKNCLLNKYYKKANECLNKIDKCKCYNDSLQFLEEAGSNSENIENVRCMKEKVCLEEEMPIVLEEIKPGLYDIPQTIINKKNQLEKFINKFEMHNANDSCLDYKIPKNNELIIANKYYNINDINGLESFYDQHNKNYENYKTLYVEVVKKRIATKLYYDIKNSLFKSINEKQSDLYKLENIKKIQLELEKYKNNLSEVLNIEYQKMTNQIKILENIIKNINNPEVLKTCDHLDTKIYKIWDIESKLAKVKEIKTLMDKVSSIDSRLNNIENINDIEAIENDLKQINMKDEINDKINDVKSRIKNKRMEIKIESINKNVNDCNDQICLNNLLNDLGKYNDIKLLNKISTIKKNITNKSNRLLKKKLEYILSQVKLCHDEICLNTKTNELRGLNDISESLQYIVTNINNAINNKRNDIIRKKQLSLLLTINDEIDKCKDENCLTTQRKNLDRFIDESSVKDEPVKIKIEDIQMKIDNKSTQLTQIKLDDLINKISNCNDLKKIYNFEDEIAKMDLKDKMIQIKQIITNKKNKLIENQLKEILSNVPNCLNESCLKSNNDNLSYLKESQESQEELFKNKVANIEKAISEKRKEIKENRKREIIQTHLSSLQSIKNAIHDCKSEFCLIKIKERLNIYKDNVNTEIKNQIINIHDKILSKENEIKLLKIEEQLNSCDNQECLNEIKKRIETVVPIKEKNKNKKKSLENELNQKEKENKEKLRNDNSNNYQNEKKIDFDEADKLFHKRRYIEAWKMYKKLYIDKSLDINDLPNLKDGFFNKTRKNFLNKIGNLHTYENKDHKFNLNILSLIIYFSNQIQDNNNNNNYNYPEYYPEFKPLLERIEYNNHFFGPKHSKYENFSDEYFLFGLINLYEGNLLGSLKHILLSFESLVQLKKKRFLDSLVDNRINWKFDCSIELIQHIWLKADDKQKEEIIIKMNSYSEIFKENDKFQKLLKNFKNKQKQLE